MCRTKLIGRALSSASVCLLDHLSILFHRAVHALKLYYKGVTHSQEVEWWTFIEQFWLLYKSIQNLDICDYNNVFNGSNAFVVAGGSKY